MSNDPDPPAEELESLGLVVRQHGVPPRPVKALVVDDEPDFREMLCELLRRFGLEAIEARHGHEALSLIDVEHPDLVFLDHRMPGLQGAHVARSLRATGHKAPVVLITGDPDVEEIAESAGTTLRLAKPFSAEALRETILCAVEGRATRRE